MSITLPTPRVWIGTWATYNEGNLYGRWIDATQSAEEIETEVCQLLNNSPVVNDEEWYIGDHEGLGRSIGEQESFERVAAIGEAVSQAYDPWAFLAWLEWSDNTGDLDKFNEEYRGQYDSDRHFAEEFWHECNGETALHGLEYHIDWDSYARELMMSGFASERMDGGVYIFEAT